MSQSPSFRRSVENSSESSVQEPATRQRKSESEETIGAEQICLSPETENNHVHTTESLFKGCRKCNGHIGVPITYISAHCSEQFNIIGSGNGKRGQEIGVGPIPKEIRQKMKGHSAAGDLYLMIDGTPRVPYNRIIIQRKRGS